ncbi:MAG: DNA methyltransferase [Frankiaceae bacterium]
MRKLTTVAADASEALPTGLGRANGTSRHSPFDRWFRYPAGFSSETAAELFKYAGVKNGAFILDPFCGSGVVGTAAASRGIAFVGVEAHPLVAELAALKLRRTTPRSPSDLIASARLFIADAAACDDVDHENETNLVRKSFDDDVLGQLIAMRTTLERQPDAQWRPWSPWLKWALLGTLRDVASVRVGWPYQNPNRSRRPTHTDPYARVIKRASLMAADLMTARQWPSPRADAAIFRGDARDSRTWQKAASTRALAGCICSPPYLNNFDYADATRLELYFLGAVRSWAELVAGPRSKMMIASTQQTKRGLADSALAWLRAIDGELGRQLRSLHDAIAYEVAERKRGKEYDRLFPCYFADMASVLAHLGQYLEPGAPAALLVGDSAPYGVYVDTPALLGALAQTEGFRVVDDIVLRKRGLRWATNTSRHGQALTERLLLLRKRRSSRR